MVERDLRFEVTERMLASGEVHAELVEAEVLAVIERLKTKHIQSVAVLFLHAYRNPAHEQRVRDQVRFAFVQHAAVAEIEVSAGVVQAVEPRAHDERVAGVTYGCVERGAQGRGQVGRCEVESGSVVTSALHH